MAEKHPFPTLNIPQGRENTVNDSGQLAIRTPGNLIIQNPGNYSHIVSTSGSLRIDPNVKVDAVTVQVADTCFIAGSLTAWHVKARRVVLERGAQAFIVIRDSETLELDKAARLVGNFASEKELYLLLGRFSQQLQTLPKGLSPAVQEVAGELAPPSQDGALLPSPEESQAAPLGGAEATGPGRSDQRPVEPSVQTWANLLAYLETVLVKEMARAELSFGAKAALHRALSAVRSGRPEEVKESFAELDMALFEYTP
ncbi:MAG: hypothetical protein NZ869_11385, partial [Thermoanaerobaculum sp.]|nr:hypothetical protein [Thermoanaerobaculum sp.]